MKKVHDDILGEYTIDEYNYISGTFRINGCEIGFSIEGGLDTGVSNEKTIEVAKKLVMNFVRLDEKMRTFAAAELTKNANDWLSDSLEEGETAPEITEEIFTTRMIPEFLSISRTAEDNINYDMYYGDDNMFWGHSIVVFCTLKDGIRSAGICG